MRMISTLILRITPNLVSVGLVLLTASRGEAGETIFSDTFDAPDATGFDTAALAGRRGGLLASTVQLKAARYPHAISGNKLQFTNPNEVEGRIRFHDAAAPADAHDFATGVAGTSMLSAGGLRIEFDWTPPNVTEDRWVEVSVGTSAYTSGENFHRVNNAGTDFGILFRNNGGTQYFDNGVGSTGPALPAPASVRHVVVDYAFSSFADGGLVTVSASVDGKRAIRNGAFTWKGNGGRIFIEIGSNSTNTLLDNLVLTAGGPTAVPAVYEPLAGFALGPEGDTATARDSGGLYRHADGFFYGASALGGAYGQGTVYRVTPSGAVQTLMHNRPTGTSPTKSVAVDGEDRVWGKISTGGANDHVFRYDLRSHEYRNMVGIGEPSGGSTYTTPPVRDGRGSIWVDDRDNSGEARLLEIDEESGSAVETRFADTGIAAAWFDPRISPLCADASGNVWGFFSYHVSGVGTFGRMFKSSSTSFYSSFPSQGWEDSGWYPGVSLGIGDDVLCVNRYWIRRYQRSSGAYLNTIDAGVETGVISIRSLITGAPVLATGRFWGCTETGGIRSTTSPYGRGTIFKMNPLPPHDPQTVAQFTGTVGPVAGRYPFGALTMDAIYPASSEWVWGRTESGGLLDKGTIFKYDTFREQFVTVADFTGVDGPYGGKAPWSELVADAQGWLWGTTAEGGRWGVGMIYKFSPATREIVKVVDFTGTSGAAPGSGNWAGMHRRADGLLWGVSVEGGTADLGTMWKVEPVTGAFTPVLEFTGTVGQFPGARPIGGLISDAFGDLWGTTFIGGSNDQGTVFRYRPSSGEYTTVVNFSGTTGTRPGAQPEARLFDDGKGFLWGTTRRGGTSGAGTVFKINVETQQFSTVASAGGWTFPTAALVADASGDLWGTFYGVDGSSSQRGGVFKVSAVTGAVSVVSDISDPAEGLGVTGSYVRTGLTRDTDGDFWGMTRDGATIFKISPGGALVPMFDLTGVDGALPGGQSGFGSMLLHTDGYLYGTTINGGRTATGEPAGGGQIFRIRVSGGFDLQSATLGVRRLTSGGVEVKLTGSTGGTFVLQRSPDMQTWSDGAALTAGVDGAVTWVDEEPFAGRAFYRVRSQ